MSKAPKNELRILGTGTSTGTPMVGCHCNVCSSSDYRDKRLRTSILLKIKNKTILVDTTPDLRYQLLRENIDSVDAALITHDHADHLHGIDDLRPYCFGPPIKTIPVVCSQSIGEQLKSRFPYIFDAKKLFNKERPIIGGGIPHLELKEVTTSQLHTTKITLCEVELELFALPHGYTETVGILHDKFAYIPDCKKIAPEIISYLKSKKLDLLIIDCLQEAKHETHLNFEEAFSYIEELSPKRAGLIHMNHETLHETLTEKAKLHFQNSSIEVFPLYDRQSFTYN